MSRLGTLRQIVIWLIVLLLLVGASLFIWNPSRFTRAVRLTLTDFGGWVQLLAVLVALIVNLARQGWRGMKALTRWQLFKEVGGGWLCFWYLVLLYHCFWPPDFSIEEVIAYSEGTVASVSTEARTRHTGFWADEDMLLFTWLEAENHKLEVGMLMPPLPDGVTLRVTGGIMTAIGHLAVYDMETKVAVVSSEVSPFHHKLRPFIVGKATTGKVVDKLTAHYARPQLNAILPTVGDEIVVGIVEPGDNSIVWNARHGRVVRIGVANGRERPLRMYTDVPFQNSFSGGPVFNLRKQVIGIVSGESSGTCILIPSRVLIEALKQIKHE